MDTKASKDRWTGSHRQAPIPDLANQGLSEVDEPAWMRPGRDPGPPRILIYSHDTFGLGHLRRSRAIANALIDHNADASILILTGSPAVGNFEFGTGIDYVRIPGVVKLANGEYSSLNLKLPLEESVRLRSAIIARTAETFDPDILIVDKEPSGFRGELLDTLAERKLRGSRIILGLRDVLDDAQSLRSEWERKGATEAIGRFYDEIWVYGLRRIHDPLSGLPMPRSVPARMRFTGYLRRELPELGMGRAPKITRGPFLLVTAGGGGDGYDMIDWVISAYETDPGLPLPALIVFGPFMGRDQRRTLMTRIAPNPRLDAIAFDSKLEHLINRASGIVAMGGYNTFCEILSFDRPALIVPRRRPRLEQTIRARAAARLGLIDILEEAPDGTRTASAMASAIRNLALEPRQPSRVLIPGLLDGLDWIVKRTAPWMAGLRSESNASSRIASTG